MLNGAIVEEFKTSVRGVLIQPSDAEYEDARKVWNGMIDKRPALVLRCADDSDVIKAVQFANSHNLLVAVRGGGHNVAGFGTCDDGLVIDLSAMKEITVDARERIATAQGGLTWGEFDKATQEFALATTGGLVSTTGIAGFTLGGGIGWLMRKHGMTIDNLLSVEMVTADGNSVTANEKVNADLFWGVRGGGGNFGIVTRFTYRLHPVGPTVFGGALFYAAAKAKDLLRFYRGWVHKLPDELTTLIVFLTAPPAPFIPRQLQGTPMVAIAMCLAGAVEQGDALIKPLREFAQPEIDQLGPIPYTQLQNMFDAGAPRGIQSYWKTEYLSGLDDQAINTLIEHVAKMGAPFAQVHIHHIEGAVGRVDNGATAFGHRDTPFILNILGMCMDSAETDRHIAWVRAFAKGVQPYSTGATYLNFLGVEGEARVKAAYGDKKYDRLVQLKNKYDPRNLFHVNQNIKPAR
ncbi:MAG TPA: FAD-binding oxidoreductase [Desulfomonilaceae bacterium]|nr:FAD-binding oxidoreductase [Desulfomonilaceae bacterium]